MKRWIIWLIPTALMLLFFVLDGCSVGDRPPAGELSLDEKAQNRAIS